MKMKKKRRKIEKAVLFIVFTILSMILYYRVIPIVNRYGMVPFYEADYTNTDFFGRAVEYRLMDLESNLDRAKDISEYAKDVVGVSNFEYIIEITTVQGYRFISTNIEMIADLEKEKEQFSTSKFYYICSLNSAPQTNIEHLRYYRFHADQSEFSKLDVYVRINHFEKQDSFRLYKENYENFSHHVIPLMATCGSLLLICLTLFIHLVVKEPKEKWKNIDRLYNEELISIALLVIVFFINMLWETTSAFVYANNILKYIMYGISYWSLQEICFAFVRRIKRKELIQNFMFPKLLENMKYIYSIIWKLGIVFSIFAFVIVMINRQIYWGGSDIYSLLLFGIVIVFHLLAIVLEKVKIERWLEKMANGDYTEQIQEKTTFFEEIVNRLNALRKGMQSAVEEKIKSQRLKTDLITNVSHDLKTPLTAIINYINLLKKEKIENEKAEGYIAILEEKSKKLKNLTEDLIEASKISSGNEIANLEWLNFAEMVQQANGEFAGMMEEKGLILISHIEEEEMYTYLDSKKMWRVLENVYGNVTKYALENTRVYVKLQRKENAVLLSIKNISKEELDIKPEELMERFVRGDRSRSTSGSGLGLSISKDLVELQNGKFDIFIEGDLFKVIIELKKY